MFLFAGRRDKQEEAKREERFYSFEYVVHLILLSYM